MKYKISNKGINRDGSQKISLTLIAENKSDGAILHNDIACKIAQPSEFIGALFHSIAPQFDDGSMKKNGRVELKENKK